MKKWVVNYFYPDPDGWNQVPDTLTTDEVVEWLEEQDYMTADIEIREPCKVYDREEFLARFK